MYLGIVAGWDYVQWQKRTRLDGECLAQDLMMLVATVSSVAICPKIGIHTLLVSPNDGTRYDGSLVFAFHTVC